MRVVIACDRWNLNMYETLQIRIKTSRLGRISRWKPTTTVARCWKKLKTKWDNALCLSVGNWDSTRRKPWGNDNSEGVWQLDNRCRLIWNNALKTKTLGVPARWNKLASCRGRLFCWEVEKTCERNAISLETYQSRRTMMALRGKKPEKALGIQPMKLCAEPWSWQNSKRG